MVWLLPKAKAYKRDLLEIGWETNSRWKESKVPFKKAFQGIVANDLELETTSRSSDKSPFSKDQLELLYKILGQSRSPSNPSSYFAKSGNIDYALHAFENISSKSWIIDSGASNHMTNESNNFLSYSPYSNNGKVFVANGSFIPISGEGFVSISLSITLDSILHVPKIARNLLSISKITKISWIDGLGLSFLGCKERNKE